MKDWFLQNRAGFTGDLTEMAPLAKHTYYRIGGPADLLAVPRTRADLEWLAQGIAATRIPYFLLGLGSNLLVADAGYRGLVIRMSRLDLEIESVNPGIVRAGASVAVSTLLRRASQEGWDGLEILAGVPGSVGGVVRMNAGTHLGETKDRLAGVTAFSFETGRFQDYGADQLRFSYRRNLFLKPGEAVISARWAVTPADPAAVKAKVDDTLARRKATQPVDFPSCGSVFKNPPGDHSWAVIDRLGLRGHQIGDAQISKKHANFIINLGKATAADVRGLIDLAKRRAAAELGIQLEEEVIYLGFGD
jgi:UDP-N-acetylmuramate dehydrogenase